MTSSIFVSSLVLMAGAFYVAAGTSYIVEVYFVVEPQVTKKYTEFGYSEREAYFNVKNDIEYVLNGVNEIFGSLKTGYGLDVQIRPKAIKMMGKGEVMFEDCKLIDHTDLQADMGLAVFKDWLKKTDAEKKIGYDIALVWTGFDVFGGAGNKGVTGYATTSVVCDPKNAVAVVEFDGSQNTAITTAHEIAHSMGASHDQGPSCPASAGFVETPVSHPSNQRRWEFSFCSYKAILDKINRLNQNTNCLTQTSAKARPYNLAKQANKDILDIQKTCQRATNSRDGYFCQSSNLYRNAPISGDTVCKMIYCGISKSGSCRSAMPPEGMACGVNKRCKKGSCVSSSVTTPNVTDNACPFGDEQSHYIQQEEQTCKEYIQKKGGGLCYHSSFRSKCCAACKTLETNIPTCEYGDKASGCSSYEARSICPGNSALCCLKCRGFRGRRSDYTTAPYVNLTEPLNEDPETFVVEDEISQEEHVSMA